MRRAPGITLIEVLIYVLFIGLIMTGVILLAAAAFTIHGKLQATAILQQNMRFATTRVTSLVTAASSITSPATGTNSGTLILAMASSTSNPTTITISNGTITMTQGTGTAMALTSNELEVTHLAFSRASSTSAFVQIVITAGLRGAISSYPTLTVTTTAAVRR